MLISEQLALGDYASTATPCRCYSCAETEREEGGSRKGEEKKSNSLPHSIQEAGVKRQAGRQAGKQACYAIWAPRAKSSDGLSPKSLLGTMRERDVQFGQ